ncbi:cysteine hydrolase family protein [Actinomadura decatromicini]|uniref:Cysteine hydrolase n=1 Tax=Actinomadura decatromicini TaxID=2604572 RepID=A0A5D3FP10_9ACTN|nr:isochorismatase family cysteine hydrolase [Actinomadura decatromicini]TYK49656.1 cysteine hydrolase [Actinomadura decatromicini]
MIEKDALNHPLPGDEHTRPDFARAALLTIDMQADFISGPHAVPGTQRVVPAVARLARAFRNARRPIVHLVRLYLPDGGDADLSRRSLIASGARLVAPHSPGSRLADDLAPPGAAPLDPDRLLSDEPQRLAEGEHVIYKPRWSAFHRTPLQRHLADLGVNTLVVAGCNYPNCPRATIYDASARDYRLVIAEDATSRFGEHARPEMTGIAAWCLTVAAIEGHLRTDA